MEEKRDFGDLEREVYEVASTDEEIRKACQDGGAVTSLLAYALDDAIVEG